jgi:hypothetical protein
MATGTGGSTTTTVLTSLIISGAQLPADVATIANLIFDDRVNLYPNNPTATLNAIPTAAQGPFPGAFVNGGYLYVPNRGILRTFPGDIVMVDTVSGWPILVSRTAAGIGGTVWAHSP